MEYFLKLMEYFLKLVTYSPKLITIFFCFSSRLAMFALFPAYI